MRSHVIEPPMAYGSSPFSFTLTHSPAYANYTAAAGTSTAILSATNATPIRIQATAHGLVDNDRVAVGGVGGGGGANGIWHVVRVDDDNVDLIGSSGTASMTASTGRIQKLSKTATAQVLDHFLVSPDSTITNYVPFKLWPGDYDPATDEPIYSQNFRNRASSDIDRANGVGRGYLAGPRSISGFIIEADTSSGGWSVGQTMVMTALSRMVN